MTEVKEFDDFVAEATDWIATRIEVKQADGLGVFRLSLCGGSTPKGIYAALAAREGIDWSRVLLSFGDERCVPADHADSNYRMVKEALLDPAEVPGGSVMRMAGELPPEEAAQRYDGQLAKLAGLAGEAIFVHDLVLLGMGDDGHTASLFPGTTALEETERSAVANYVPKFDSWRLTLTYPVINAARQVAFLVKGELKRPVVDEVLAGGSPHPAEGVRAAKVSWLIG